MYNINFVYYIITILWTKKIPNGQNQIIRFKGKTKNISICINNGYKAKSIY